MSRSFGGTLLTTRPPIQTLPSVMSSSPATMRSAVVLPQPDGPTRTTSSPSAMSRLRPSTALVPSSYTLLTFSSTTPATAAPGSQRTSYALTIYEPVTEEPAGGSGRNP